MAALTAALHTLPAAEAAMIMSVAANAARDFAAGEASMDATHAAQWTATAAMRAAPLADEKWACRVLGEFAERAISWAANT